MNFFGQTGKILISSDSDTGSASCTCRSPTSPKETKFAKDHQVVIPIELTGYRSYSMELLEQDRADVETDVDANPEEVPLIEIGNREEAERRSPSPEAQKRPHSYPPDPGDGDEREREDEVRDLRHSFHGQNHHDHDRDDDLVQSPTPITPLLTQNPEDSVLKSTAKEPTSDYIPNPKIYSKNRTNIQILQSFLAFGYYMGLVPFRFQTTDRLRWRLRLYDRYPQTVFCGFAHILVICFGANKWADPDLYVIFSNSRDTAAQVSRADYLRFVLAISETLYTLLFILVLWSKKSTFRWLAKNYFVKNEVTTIHSSYHSFLLALQNRFFLSAILIPLFCCVGVDLFLFEYSQLDPDEPLFGPDGYIVRQALAFIFIDPDNLYREVHPVVVSIASTLYVFSGFMYSMIYAMTHLFTCVLALIVYDVGSHFVNRLNSKAANLEIGGALDLYERVKQFVRAINDAFGMLVLLVAFTIIPFIGKNLPIVFSSDADWLTRLVGILLIVNFGLLLWCGVNFTSQIKRLREWLGQQDGNSDFSGGSSNARLPSQPPPGRLQAIYSELADESIGLSGCGLFTVSRAFVGALVQLMLIYAFIAIGSWDRDMQGDRDRAYVRTLEIGDGSRNTSAPGLSFVE